MLPLTLGLLHLLKGSCSCHSSCPLQKRSSALAQHLVLLVVLGLALLRAVVDTLTCRAQLEFLACVSGTGRKLAGLLLRGGRHRFGHSWLALALVLGLPVFLLAYRGAVADLLTAAAPLERDTRSRGSKTERAADI